MTDAVSRDRLVPIYEALAQWRMFARAATSEARIDQRHLSLDLLQATRQLAAGLEALTRLEEQHRRQRTVLANVHGSATHAARQIEHRLTGMRRLDHAAERLMNSDESSAAARARASQLRTRVAGQLAALDAAAQRTQLIINEVVRLQHRHHALDAELGALRTLLVESRALTERGLVVMGAARVRLDAAEELYEAAQLTATDFGRDTADPAAPRPVAASA